VAREASAIVLLDDDFSSIVASIRLGRRIYDNLRKAMGFIFAVHVPIAGLALLPLVLGLPILFGPVHIAFVEMVIDPVCTLVFEAETEEDNVMRRPPHAPDAPLFSGPLIVWGLLQGTCAFLLVAVVFTVALQAGHAGSGSARTRVLFVGDDHRQPNLRQSLLRRVRDYGTPPAQSDPGIGASRGRNHVKLDASLAVCPKPLPFWSAAPR
jgi:magnesium-transporting ATPase (P-type)